MLLNEQVFFVPWLTISIKLKVNAPRGYRAKEINSHLYYCLIFLSNNSVESRPKNFRFYIHYLIYYIK